AARAAGARPARTLRADHEVVGGVRATRADPGIHRNGVSPRACATPRARLPRVADGRPIRGSGRPPGASLAVERADVRRPARGDESGRLAERLRAPGGDRRQWLLVGRRVETARPFCGVWAAADDTQRLGSRLDG